MQPKPGTREKKPSLVKQVTEALRLLITSGEIGPGGKLPSEAALTAKHNVSRTVVREAIAALRSDGLVEPRQGRGFLSFRTFRPAEILSRSSIPKKYPALSR